MTSKTNEEPPHKKIRWGIEFIQGEALRLETDIKRQDEEITALKERMNRVEK